MSRITAPASKLTRTLLESQRSAGAVLMPKYDELLRSRRTDESRHITTKHRPTPQPSIANRPKPLMQGFHSSAPSYTPKSHLDATVLPAIYRLPASDEPLPRMPLLPDNYTTHHSAFSDAADLASQPGTIVAANPDAVVPGAPLAGVEGISIDGVELKFAHEEPAKQDHSSMIGDIWRGMVADVVGGGPQSKAA